MYRRDFSYHHQDDKPNGYERLIWHSLMKHKKCFTPKTAKDYQITQIYHTLARKYQLSTLYEGRKIQISEEPYYKGFQPNKTGQTYNSIWKTKFEIPNDLSTMKKEILGSSSIIKCDNCSGSGWSNCTRCRGEKDVHCEHCFGTGYRCCSGLSQNRRRTSSSSSSCERCYGRGKERCCFCYGEGGKSCSKCCGRGKLIQVEEIVAEWTKKCNSQVFGVPYYLSQFLEHCDGTELYYDESSSSRYPLQPVDPSLFSDEKVVQTSFEMLEEHQYFHPEFKIRSQMHSVSDIDLYLVTYRHKKQLKTVWMVGEKFKVVDFKKKKRRKSIF